MPPPAASRFRCSERTIRLPTAHACATTSTSSDLADAHVLALRHLESGGASATYNVGTERPSSVREVIQAVERVDRTSACRGGRRRAVPAIRPWCMPRRRASAPSWAGRRVGPTSTRSWPTRGGGIRRIHTDSRPWPTDVASPRDSSRPAAVGRDAVLQRGGDDRGDHPARDRRAAAHAADRRGRRLEGRHARHPVAAAAGARVHAGVSALESGQGRGAPARLRRGPRRHRRHPGCGSRVFAGGISRC